MREIERDDVVELAARTHCAVCKTPYGRHGVQVLGRRGDAWIIAVNCAHCDAEGLMIATIEEHAETGILDADQEDDPRPTIIYDVSYDEWLDFQERPTIDRDDVLDMHHFLREFDGDFEGLAHGNTSTEER